VFRLLGNILQENEHVDNENPTDQNFIDAPVHLDKLPVVKQVKAILNMLNYRMT